MLHELFNGFEENCMGASVPEGPARALRAHGVSVQLSRANKRAAFHLQQYISRERQKHL